MASAVWDANDPEHRTAFSTALAPLVAVLWKRKEDFGAIEARIYMRTLKQVPAPILEAAIDKSLATDTWFPEPAKLLGYAADAMDDERKAVCQKWLADCNECYGTRWVDLVIDGVVYEKRCGCFTRTMRAIAEIGEPLRRKELPPGNPNVELV